MDSLEMRGPLPVRKEGTMRSVIKQLVLLPASADELFAAYLDPVRHAAITGGAVTISPAAGTVFSAFDGVLNGTMLAVVPSRLIVQAWRSAKFRDEDPDSTLVLSFTQQGDRGRIDLVHLDVPEHDCQGVNEGWELYYWTPWREYLDLHG
jgi:activator of HSP90 ATPase